LQWSDNGHADQRWTFVKQICGAHTIVNANSGKLINIPRPATTASTQLIQYHDGGGTNSRQTLVDAVPGMVGLKRWRPASRSRWPDSAPNCLWYQRIAVDALAHGPDPVRQSDE
jgi:hypothetical protein